MRLTGTLIAGLVGASCLLAACTTEDGMLGVSGKRARQTTSQPSPPPSDSTGDSTGDPSDDDPGSTQGNLTPDAGRNPQPTPEPPKPPFVLNQATVTLTVPPNGGGTPLFPISAQLGVKLGNTAVTPFWSMQDSRIAVVDDLGQIKALREGSTVVYAEYQERIASASVRVESRGRLQILPENVPDGTDQTLVTVYDQTGKTIATGNSQLDLPSASGLSVTVEARRAGTLRGLGRWEGIIIQPNQLTTYAVPLNVPRLHPSAAHGGPGAQVTISGSGLTLWKKGQFGALVDWIPQLQAQVSGQTAAVLSRSDSWLTLQMPALSGSPAIRALAVTVEGIPLDGSVRLLGSLTVDSPQTTMAIGETVPFTVLAADTDGQNVPMPNVAWSVVGSDPESPRPGSIDENGMFQAERAGTGFVVVRSGTLSRSVAITVMP